MWHLEKRALALGDALAGGFEERLEEAIDLSGGSGRCGGDEDIVFLGEKVRASASTMAPKAASFTADAGGELAATGGNLDDAVGFRLGESLERPVDGGEGGDVDGRVGVAAFLGGIEHGAVLRGSCDWHDAARGDYRKDATNLRPGDTAQSPEAAPSLVIER